MFTGKDWKLYTYFAQNADHTLFAVFEKQKIKKNRTYIFTLPQRNIDVIMFGVVMVTKDDHTQSISNLQVTQNAVNIYM